MPLIRPRSVFHLVVVVAVGGMLLAGRVALHAQQLADESIIADDFGEELNESAEDEEGEEEEDELESDRDSFTRSPRLMPPGQTMVELSYTFLDQPEENDGHIYPDLLIRYGLNELVELRLGWTYEDAKFDHLAPPGGEPVAEGIINYGAKVCLTHACGAVPDSSLAITGYTPTSGESNDSDFSLEYVYGWKLCEWEVDGMVRWFSLAEEEDRFTELAPSLVVKRNVLCNRASVHVEYFSLHSCDREENYDQEYFGPGAHYLVTPNLEIGARVFWGLSDDAADFIGNVGLAARF